MNIQRRLALLTGFFDARSQIHLQRVVVQHHFLGVGRAEMAHNDHGTRILGAHIEGPFFNIDNRGAHAIPMLQDPTMENYKAMAGEYEDVIARVSLAPEKKGGMELVRYLAGKGVVVAATVEEAEKAVREMMEDHKFGSSGSTVVIEECMVGPEVTVLA